ncbi:MAG TPA: C40 family peptidase [Puia sp.]|nr:C40 family peptidase [Puia sp.]
MKNLFFLIVIACLVTGCSTLKPAGSVGATNREQEQKQSSIQFLDNVSINSGNNTLDQGKELVNVPPKKMISRQPARLYYASAIENFSPLQFKYAILEDAEVEDIRNEKLLEFMEDWYGTKYHFGGVAKDGIDCSAFVSTLMSGVYGISNLPRMSRDQYAATVRVSKKDLKEGDLVFFHTYGRKRKAVTHVGVYLRNNKFIHASVSGVMISDMGEGYYSTHFVGAGRIVDAGMRDAAAN